MFASHNFALRVALYHRAFVLLRQAKIKASPYIHTRISFYFPPSLISLRLFWLDQLLESGLNLLLQLLVRDDEAILLISAN